MRKNIFKHTEQRIKTYLCILMSFILLVSFSSFSVCASKSRFTDIGGNEYYADAADALAEMGIISGYFDGSFGADKTITRAEMATIICRVIGDNSSVLSAGKTFADVKESHWAMGYIERAYKNGIINGDGNGKFRPEDSVSFDEAVKMIVCAFGYEKDVKKNSSDWARGYIETASNKGFLRFQHGSRGGVASRGDVAVMIYNAIGGDVSVPYVSLESGSYIGAQTVTLSTDTEGAEIYYTLNGKDPIKKGIKYKKPFKIDEDCTLQAVTVKNNTVSSGIIVKTYTIGAETFTLEMEATEGGIYKYVEGNYKEGEEIYLEATPNDGYEFGGWSSDNGGSFSDRHNPYSTFIMPDDDVTIRVSFAAKNKNVQNDDTNDNSYNDYEEINAEEKESEKDNVEITQPTITPARRVTYYSGSVIPKYESITGSPQVVTALSFNQSNASITRYFYNSNEDEKNEYIDYLYESGWTLNGTSTGGDSRGKSEQSGFSFKDENGNVVAQVEIDFFPDCGDVDIVCVVKAK